MGQVAGVQFPGAIGDLAEGGQSIKDGAGFRRKYRKGIVCSLADGGRGLGGGAEAEGEKDEDGDSGSDDAASEFDGECHEKEIPRRILRHCVRPLHGAGPCGMLAGDFWRKRTGQVEIFGLPPIRDESANGWGTVDLGAAAGEGRTLQ